jgi:hypothetical protein
MFFEITGIDCREKMVEIKITESRARELGLI